MTKYKYYFKKPRSAIAKDILNALLTTGMWVIAANSPYFIIALWRKYRWRKLHPKRKFYSTFYNLLKRGYVEMEKYGYDLKITLTDKGKELASWMQIDALEIKKPKKWDKKWRVVIFDIAELNRRERDAFRYKLKELGFKYIQKSAWVHPYECRDEIELLKKFFGLKDKDAILFTAERIDGAEWLKDLFNLK